MTERHVIEFQLGYNFEDIIDLIYKNKIDFVNLEFNISSHLFASTQNVYFKNGDSYRFVKRSSNDKN